MQNVVGILFALLAVVILASGNVIQKKGSLWMKWEGRKNLKFVKYFAIWLGGFILYNLSLVPNAMASKTLPPYIISAVSGLGITFIIVLSYFFLKEKLFKTDIFYSVIIVVSIFAP